MAKRFGKHWVTYVIQVSFLKRLLRAFSALKGGSSCSISQIYWTMEPLFPLNMLWVKATLCSPLLK